MQDDEMAFFIFMMTALIAVSVIILSWIKHRSPKQGGESRREVELLTSENSGLRSQVSRLEERIAVLERIATDPAERTAREIEQLRHG
jgi:hypothetical protein